MNSREEYFVALITAVSALLAYLKVFQNLPTFAIDLWFSVLFFFGANFLFLFWSVLADGTSKLLDNVYLLGIGVKSGVFRDLVLALRSIDTALFHIVLGVLCFKLAFIFRSEDIVISVLLFASLMLGFGFVSLLGHAIWYLTFELWDSRKKLIDK